MTVLLPISLIIASVLLYQIGQKALPIGMNHWHALIIYYLIALVVVFGFMIFERPEKTLLESAKSTNWAVIMVALSIVGIELGWILAFRAGANLNTTGIIVNAVVGVLVIPIGVWFFQEKFTWVNLIGILLSLFGLFLITRK
jgi:drug/metabolite transporter (DMT)-like permease